MGSPLDLVLSIPPEYWTGGGLFLFLTAVEKKFNVVERIRTERAEQAAQRAEARAREREAELREAAAERQLSELRSQMLNAESQVSGFDDADVAFQLQRGDLAPEREATPQAEVSER